MLKKGLKRISDIMEQPGFAKFYDNPNKEMIDSIVFSSQGDIRSAVINLHFASQKSEWRPLWAVCPWSTYHLDLSTFVDFRLFSRLREAYNGGYCGAQENASHEENEGQEE